MLFFHGKHRGKPKAGISKAVNYRYVLIPTGDEIELWIEGVLVDTISLDNHKIAHKSVDTPTTDLIIANQSSSYNTDI